MMTGKIFALILTGALLLSGCGTDQKKAPKIFVEPTKLTESEQELLDFVGVDQDIIMFNYTIDNTVKKITIDTLNLNEHNQWESSGGVASSNDMSDAKMMDGRIMIAPSADGSIRFAESHGTGKTSWSSDARFLDSLVGDGGKLSSRQEDTVEIVYDQPIPLVMFARSTGDTMRTYSLSEYQDTSLFADYDAVSVVTICFSQKEMS